MPSTTWIRSLAVAMVAIAAGGACAPEAGAQESTAPAAAAKTSPRPIPRQSRQSAIDARVQLLARELDLDANQQVEVRKILVQHRAEVSRTWSDESQPAPMRLAATRAVGDRTAERIRAMLNEKQREKYLKARPSPSDNAQPATKVETWINAVGNK